MEPEEDCSTEWFKKFSQLRIELHMDHIMTAFLLNHAETIVAKNLMRNFVSHATTFQQAELGAEVRRDGAGGGLLHRVV